MNLFKENLDNLQCTKTTVVIYLLLVKYGNSTHTGDIPMQVTAAMFDHC